MNSSSREVWAGGWGGVRGEKKTLTSLKKKLLIH